MQLPTLLLEDEKRAGSRFCLIWSKRIDRSGSQATANAHPKNLRGLKEFKKDYPPAICYLFYGGSTILYFEDITVLPIEQALRDLEWLLLNQNGKRKTVVACFSERLHIRYINDKSNGGINKPAVDYNLCISRTQNRHYPVDDKR